MPEIKIEVTEEEKAILQEIAARINVTLPALYRQMLTLQLSVCRHHLKSDCGK